MKRINWWLLGIMFLALILRWWHLADWFHFTMDEELIAWRGWGLFKLNRPFLIGGISPLQIHLPPYFYYFSALLLWPWQFNPVGWGWWAGLFSLITIYLIYRYSRSLTASLLYAVSLNAVAFDRHYWPLFFNPIFTLLTLWFLKKKNNLGLILTLVLAVTADPSNLTLGLFVIFYNYKALKYWWLGGGLFLAPLLAFDLRHNWQNFSGIFKLFNNITDKSANWQSLGLLPQSLSRFWFTVQTNLIEIYSYCRLYADVRLQPIWWLWLMALIIIVVAVFKSRIWRWLLLSYFIGLVIFGWLGFSVYDHYLTGLMPVWAVITAAEIKKLPRKIGLGLILIFIVVNLYQFSQISNPYGLKNKKDLVKWANQYLTGSSWELQSESKCHKENGLRYLFELSGNPPVKSFMDNNFSWLYPLLPAAAPVDKILLVSDKLFSGSEAVLTQKNFGAINAYILKP